MAIPPERYAELLAEETARHEIRSHLRKQQKRSPLGWLTGPIAIGIFGAIGGAILTIGTQFVVKLMDAAELKAQSMIRISEQERAFMVDALPTVLAEAKSGNHKPLRAMLDNYRTRLQAKYRKARQDADLIATDALIELLDAEVALAAQSITQAARGATAAGDTAAAASALVNATPRPAGAAGTPAPTLAEVKSRLVESIDASTNLESVPDLAAAPQLQAQFDALRTSREKVLQADTPQALADAAQLVKEQTSTLLTLPDVKKATQQNLEAIHQATAGKVILVLNVSDKQIAAAELWAEYLRRQPDALPERPAVVVVKTYGAIKVAPRSKQSEVRYESLANKPFADALAGKLAASHSNAPFQAQSEQIPAKYLSPTRQNVEVWLHKDAILADPPST
jgi:hypothetical protein